MEEEGLKVSTVEEIIRKYREATPELQAKVMDYLRRTQSPDPAVREKAYAELRAEAALMAQAAK